MLFSKQDELWLAVNVFIHQLEKKTLNTHFSQLKLKQSQHVTGQEDSWFIGVKNHGDLQEL